MRCAKSWGVGGFSTTVCGLGGGVTGTCRPSLLSGPRVAECTCFITVIPTPGIRPSSTRWVPGFAPRGPGDRPVRHALCPGLRAARHGPHAAAERAGAGLRADLVAVLGRADQP